MRKYRKNKMTIENAFVQRQYVPKEIMEDISNYFHTKIDNYIIPEYGTVRYSTQYIGGWYGALNKSLYLEDPKNPIHYIIEKLKAYFGNFELQDGSCLKYIIFPLMPHTDITIKKEGQEWQQDFAFLIPLFWKKNYKAGTIFLNTPKIQGEQNYRDVDICPKFAAHMDEKNDEFSVKQICMWENPGDLIAWKSLQYHCSSDTPNWKYTHDSWNKSFIILRAKLL